MKNLLIAIMFLVSVDAMADDAPGGRDLQLTYSASDCTQLSADYFIKAEDGTVVQVFNEGLVCPGAERTIFRPRLEAQRALKLRCLLKNGST